MRHVGSSGRRNGVGFNWFRPTITCILVYCNGGVTSEKRTLNIRILGVVVHVEYIRNPFMTFSKNEPVQFATEVGYPSSRFQCSQLNSMWDCSNGL